MCPRKLFRTKEGFVFDPLQLRSILNNWYYFLKHSVKYRSNF